MYVADVEQAGEALVLNVVTDVQQQSAHCEVAFASKSLYVIQCSNHTGLLTASKSAPRESTQSIFLHSNTREKLVRVIISPARRST